MHPTNEVRNLTYDDWTYPVIHESMAASLDELGMYNCTPEEWKLADNNLIEHLILQGVILHNQGGTYSEGVVYKIDIYRKGLKWTSHAHIRNGEWREASLGESLSKGDPVLGRITLHGADLDAAIELMLSVTPCGDSELDAAIATVRNWVDNK